MARRKKRQLKKSVLLIVDGETEQAYFENFKTPSIHIIPELPQRKNLKQMYKDFKNILESEKDLYDEIFWIVDCDKFYEEEKLNDLKNYKRNYPDLILINNPCLEYWFVLHFVSDIEFSYQCKEVVSWLKRNKKEIFQHYDKNIEDFKNKIIPVLQKNLTNAIARAKKRGCNIEEKEMASCSELYKFFEILISFELYKS